MTGSGDDDKGRWPVPDYDDAAATTQMDPEDIAELHRRLAAGSAGPSEAETVMLEEERVAAEVKRRAAAKAQAVPAARPTARPAAPARPGEAPRAAAGGSGSVAFVFAGIGALFVMLAVVARLEPIQAELAGLAWARYVLAGLAIVGYGMLAPGLTLAVRRSNAIAGIAALFCYLAVIGSILVISIAGEVEPDVAGVIALSALGAATLVWVFIGLWGLSSTGTIGGLAGGLGILALLGGLGSAAALIAPFINGFNDPDTRELLGYVGLGAQAAVGVAALFTAIAFFGPVRSAPIR